MMIDLEYQIELVLINAVDQKKDFHQIAGEVGSIFYDTKVSVADRGKILENLKALIQEHKCGA